VKNSYNSYNKIMHKFLKFIFGIKLYSFGHFLRLKHVEFCSKNKFEKLVHLVGIIMGIVLFYVSYIVKKVKG